MAAYTLTAAVGTFAETGNAVSAQYGLFPSVGVFCLNPPRSVAYISKPPAIGTNLFWNRADGAYYVVFNQS